LRTTDAVPQALQVLCGEVLPEPAELTTGIHAGGLGHAGMVSGLPVTAPHPSVTTLRRRCDEIADPDQGRARPRRRRCRDVAIACGLVAASAPTVVAVLAHVTTFSLSGLEPHRVTVEVDLRAGLPAFTVVGLGDQAVREARERVRAAILNSASSSPPSG
jgi:hypothetical protein